MMSMRYAVELKFTAKVVWMRALGSLMISDAGAGFVPPERVYRAHHIGAGTSRRLTPNADPEG